MNSKKVRCAVIGLGWVGTHRHVLNLRRHPQVELVGLIDRKEGCAEQLAQRLGVPHWATCRDGQASWMQDVDAVVIATDTRSHHPLAMMLLNRGKHVLLEKPMAMNVEQGREILALSQRVNRVLAVVHNFQFARSLKALQRILEQGALGDVRAMLVTQLSNPSRRLPTWYDEIPLGLFYDESPHLLYLIRRFAPLEPQLLNAQIVSSPSGKQTPLVVNAQFQSGPVPIHVYMNFEAPVSEWHVMVVGSKRVAVADLFRDILVVVRNDGSHRARDILRTTRDAFSTHMLGFIKSGVLLAMGGLRYGNDEVIVRFIQAVQEQKPPQGISGSDGLWVLEMQHRIIAMARRV